MKKKIFLFLGLTVFLVLSGCQQQTESNSDEGKLYYVEFGEIDQTDFMSILSPYQAQYSSAAELSFNEIKAIRNALRNCNTYDFASNADVPRKDLKDYFTSHGCTPSETKEIMKELDDRGNTLKAFTSINDNHIVYMYIEKTE